MNDRMKERNRTLVEDSRNTHKNSLIQKLSDL